MNDPKLLLFDLDGTLVRTGGAGIRALVRSFKTLYGLDDPLDGVIIAGNTDPLIFREIVQLRLPGRAPIPREEEVFFEHYLKYLQEEVLVSPGYFVLPGIRETLEKALSIEGLHVGLGTGNLEQGARIKLERGGLNPYFSFGGFGSDSHIRAEVLRIAVERACEKFDVHYKPEDVVIIGDTPRDIQAARAIRATAVCLATGGYSVQQLQEHEPDIALRDCTDTENFFRLIGCNGMLRSCD